MSEIQWINYNVVRSYDQLFHITVLQIQQGCFQYVKLRQGADGRIGWQNGPAKDRSVPHRHNFYELVYVQEGVLTQHLEQSTNQLQAGDAMLLNCGVHHWEGNESDCTVLFFSLYPQLLQQLFSENVLFPGCSQYPGTAVPAFVTSHGRQEDVRAYLDFSYSMERRSHGLRSPVAEWTDRLTTAAASREPGYAYLAQALLLQIMAALEDPTLYHLSQVNISTTTEEVLFARIVHFLIERNGCLSRTELGEAMHYNGDYLNRVVKQSCGKTIHQLAQEIRIRAAGVLLRQSERSITEIMEQLQFSNRTHFYRLFRDQMGCSPVEYRRGRSHGNVTETTE